MSYSKPILNGGKGVTFITFKGLIEFASIFQANTSFPILCDCK